MRRAKTACATVSKLGGRHTNTPTCINIYSNMTKGLSIFFILACGTPLMIQSNGVTPSQNIFCIGDMLVFTCTLAVSGYDWVVLPFLNGTVHNGRVLLNTTSAAYWYNKLENFRCRV